MALNGVVLAASIRALPLQLGHIFYFIVLPVLLLAGVGFLIQRRLGLDMATMSRLNFYFILPGVIYSSIVTSQLTGKDAGKVVLFSLAMVVCLGVVTLAAAWLRGIPRDQRNVMLMTTTFYNSGNYGLPLQDLAFRATGLRAEAVMLQAFVMLTQLLINFTLGPILAAGGKKGRNWKQSLILIAKFPPIWAFAAGALTVQIRNLLGADAPHLARALLPFSTVVEYMRSAFIAVALCALGAQVALVTSAAERSPIKLSLLLRLLGGPALGLALIYMMGLHGFLAQVLLISTATPTAVNCMLLCVEFDNHPDFASRAVFYSTLLSPITVTLVIFLAQGNMLARLVIP